MHPISSQILLYIFQQSRLNRAVSTEDMRRHLAQTNRAISLRQVQRHARALREYKYIDYNERQNTYFADASYYEQNANIQERMERSIAMDGLSQAHKSQHPKGYPIVSFEAFNNFKGAENLNPIIEATRGEKQLRFQYQDVYGDKQLSPRKVGPLFLKEYLNRWYLVAWDLDKNALRIFGIDRILELKIEESHFDPEPYYQAAWDRFEHVIGLRFTDQQGDLKPMELVIRTAKTHGKLMERLPLHASQQTLDKGEDFFRFRFKVVPNFELEQRLLSMSHLMVVEEPAAYRRYFAQNLAQMLALYPEAKQKKT